MLVCTRLSEKYRNWFKEGTDDLLDDLTGRVEVDEAFVHLQLVTIPGLGTLTARLKKSSDICP